MSSWEKDSHVTETGFGAVGYADDPLQAPTVRQDRFRHERKSLKLQHIFRISDDVKPSRQAHCVDSERASFRQINEPDTPGGRSEMDRCAGVAAAADGPCITARAVPHSGGEQDPSGREYKPGFDDIVIQDNGRKSKQAGLELGGHADFGNIFKTAGECLVSRGDGKLAGRERQVSGGIRYSF